MKIVTRIVSFVAAILAFQPTVQAREKTESTQTREKAARKACLTGDFRKGVDILADLFVETHDMTWVFNSARCYQQNHRWEDALDRFAEYLRKSTNVPADEQAEIDRYIADCKSHLPSERVAPSSPAPAPAGNLTASVPPPTNPVSPSPEDGSAVGTLAVVAPASPVQDSTAGAGLRSAGLVVGLVGTAAIVTGVVLDLKTHSLVNDMYSTGYDAGKESSRKSYETWGWVSYGVGAAGIVAGITMYLLGRSRGEEAASGARVSLLPVVSPDRAMLVLQGGI